MKLIALAVIAAGAVAADSPEIAVGTTFEASDEVGAALVANGSAKLPEVKAKAGTKARVLVDCGYGKANDVVTVPAEELKAAESAGQVDSNKAAVAYAMTLDQNKPAALA